MPSPISRVVLQIGLGRAIVWATAIVMAQLDAPRGTDGLARVKFLLAHLSDPHVGPLPRPRRRELIGKRVTGYLNWTRSRSRIHDMAVLAQIVTDMKAHHPSHVAMTGDIANLG